MYHQNYIFFKSRQRDLSLCMQIFGHADRKKRRLLLLCIENATQIKLPIFLYFCINEVSKIVKSVCFGHSAVVSIVIVRCQTVVTCSLYVDSSQILSQRLPVSEEVQGDLQNKEKDLCVWWLILEVLSVRDLQGVLYQMLY